MCRWPPANFRAAAPPSATKSSSRPDRAVAYRVSLSQFFPWIQTRATTPLPPCPRHGMLNSGTVGDSARWPHYSTTHPPRINGSSGGEAGHLHRGRIPPARLERQRSVPYSTSGIKFCGRNMGPVGQDLSRRWAICPPKLGLSIHLASFESGFHRMCATKCSLHLA